MAPAGSGMAETQGVGAMDLYNRAHDADQYGGAMQNKLVDYDMQMRQKMAPPTGGHSMSRPAGAPEWYNYSGMYPAKYAIPTEMKDNLVARQAIRNAVAANGSPNVPRPDPIGDEEVEYLKSMQKQGELADFDRYINTLVDVKKPGNLKWLMEIYPEFVHRRVAQVHDDYDFAIRKQMISQWGINTFDDLHFLYLCDQGRIEGPELSRRVAKDLQYSSGWLAPGAFFQPREDGVKLPFASVRPEFGGPPGGRRSWTQSDAGQPLGSDRDLQSLAAQVVNLNVTGQGGRQTGMGDGTGITGTAPQITGAAAPTGQP